MDTSWKAAIAKYDEDVRTGKIHFGEGKFAEDYPGQAAGDEGLAEFVREHTTSQDN